MSAHNARLAAVEERQLKPIYEALDTGNVKSALTQVNKLLKKYPTPSPSTTTPPTPTPATPQNTSRQLLVALKILALVRANKLDEASTLTTTLLAETPTDENVLSTLAHSLKPLDRPKELVKMWTDAWSRATKECDEMKKKVGKKGGPSEAEFAAKMQHCEELGAQSFMSMVRTGHWAQAQSTSFKLYRAFTPKEGDAQAHPSVRYLYWSAVSAVMQSQYPTPPAPVPVLVMIPPPPQVREWEEMKKKEEEEDKKLLEQAGLTDASSHSISPSRRKKRSFALSLAKRLIDMTIDEKSKELGVSRSMNPDRFWLWGDILRRTADAAVDDDKSGLVPATNTPPHEQYAYAKQVFSTPYSAKFSVDSLHVEELRADICKKAEDRKRECEGMAVRLNAGDRNWKTFATFMDNLFHFLPSAPAEPDSETYPCLITKQEPTEPAKADEEKEGEAVKKEEEKVTLQRDPLTLEFTRAFLKRMADGDEAAGPGRERAGLLGVLEFERRIRKTEGMSSEGGPDYVDLLISYFDKFGSKPVVVEDLLPYVLELEAEGEERKKWDAFLEGIELKTDDVKSLQTTINVLKFQRLIASSSSITVESELTYAKKCASLYHDGLSLGKNLPSTELQPSDDLVVLAATALINAHHLSLKDSAEVTSSIHGPLFDTLVILEQAVTTSRWAYAPRLILTRLYRLLAAPSLAHQHYSLANLKSIQFDTLSHHVLSRASTFSLSCIGDLTLVNECVESSQIYSVNGVDTSEQLVKAFQQERYSQIADFVLLEERVDNSLQRDLTKLEHFRMKNLHEGLTPETVEVELVELRFVWGRVHFDNRDFDLLPNYQPQGAISLDELTSVGGKRLSQQWFNTMLKLWILVLHQASEQLWTEEEQKTVMGQLSTFDEAELAHLTEGEQLLITYSRALMKWLAPHHAPLKQAVMTNAVSLLSTAKAKHAASQSGTSTPNAAPVKAKSNTGRKVNGLSNGTEGTASGAAASGGDGIGVKVGDTRVITGMLTLHEPMDVPPVPADLGEVIKEHPEELDGLLDQFQKMFDDTLAKPAVLPWEYLHLAQLIHEAAFITHLVTARFALSSGKKKSHPTYKPIRTKSLAVLEHVAQAMSKLAEESDFTAEARKVWLQDRRSSGILEEQTDEQVIMVGRALMESRKKMYEGLGKGMTKALQSVAKAAGGVPVGTV